MTDNVRKLVRLEHVLDYIDQLAAAEQAIEEALPPDHWLQRKLIEFGVSEKRRLMKALAYDLGDSEKRG